MWTPITRQQHSRWRLRYGSDLTDTEWTIIAPLLPAPEETGRPRRWPMRDIMNAIFYVLRSGLPMPPWTPQMKSRGLWRFRGWQDMEWRTAILTLIRGPA